MEIIIEEISRAHKLLGRHKFLKQNVSIGRGYQNDIIVTDPHVCAEHLHLNFDGEHWIVSDQDSINGSYLDDSKINADQHIIKSGDILTLGKSQVRIVFPNHPVEASVSFSPFENLINIARNPLVLAASIALFAIITGWIFYLNNPLKVTFTQLLVPAISMTLLFAVWPGAIAVISLLTKHDTRVMSQLGVCFAFFNLMWISDVIERFVHFNTSASFPFIWLLALIPIGLAFCLFWFNCNIGFHMSERRRIVVASCLTVLLFGGSFLIQLSKKPEFNPRPKYDATLMTPAFMIVSGNSIEEFVEDSSKLFEKSAKTIKKRN
ncbi:MAG: FHA domain-containing protein [Colwellia sp.]|nr:FHA domain-containing protein [Colwellia sp.]